AEHDIFELYLTARAAERMRARAVLDFRIDCEQLEASPESRLRAFDLSVGLGNLVDRRVQRGEVSREHDQLADREPPFKDVLRAEVNHDRRAARDQYADRAGVNRLQSVQAQGRVQTFAARFDELAVRLALSREGLHDVNRGERALRDGEQTAFL